MFRLVVFTSKPIDLTSWQPSLESDFEVTYVTNEKSLLALLLTWHPHAMIYAEPQIREVFLESVLSASAHLKICLFVVSLQYDFRQELLAFQLGADHYLLASTPIESVKIRLQSSIKKNELKLPQHQNIQPIKLPQHADVIRCKDFLVYPGQNILRHKGSLVRITPVQIKLVSALMVRPGELLTREWIRKNIFDNAEMSLRSIDAHIAKLKKSAPIFQNVIINIYGRGYMFNDRHADVA